MQNKFSPYLKSKKPIIKKLIAKLSESYEYVSCLATDVFGSSISCDRYQTSIRPSGITESGFVVKVYNGFRYDEYSVNEINNKNFDSIINDIHLLTTQNYSTEYVKVKCFEEEKIKKSFSRPNEGKDYDAKEIIEILKNLINKTVSSNNLIVNASCSIETTEISKMFISNKKDLEQYYTWTNPRVFVMVRENDNTKYNYEGFGDNSIERCLEKLEKVLDNTTSIALELLKAKAPTPGIYDIITDPSITGLIAHEAFGHGVEMDMFVKDRARSVDYIDKFVASNLVTMHDGAKSAFSVASYFFDDDGVLSQDTVIIEKGVLKRGISDLLTSLELNTKPTGNGRRENYKHKAYTRMTNTFFKEGNSTLDEMIKSIDYGYMIFQTNNGMEDPKNWGIQCTAHYGREIVNGKFTGNIISPVVMSGYVIDLLNSISMISTDIVLEGSGSCGKGYKEWVRVSDGGAYMKARVKIG